MARPRKTISEPAPSPIPEVDPTTIDEGVSAGPEPVSEAGAEPPRRRGRKPGSRAARSAEPISAGALEALLGSVHLGLSIVFSAPGLVLEASETKQLAEAAARVARHYDVPGASEKTVDWTNLVGTLVVIYGSRWAAARAARPPKQPAAPPSRPSLVPGGSTAHMDFGSFP